MRLMIDFQYMKDGSVKPIFESAYQRVSPYPSGNPKLHMDTYEHSREDVFVVNKANGAHSVAVTEEELKLARVAAEEIIQNIAKKYLEQKDK